MHKRTRLNFASCSTKRIARSGCVWKADEGDLSLQILAYDRERAIDLNPMKCVRIPECRHNFLLPTTCRVSCEESLRTAIRSSQTGSAIRSKPRRLVVIINANSRVGDFNHAYATYVVDST